MHKIVSCITAYNLLQFTEKLTENERPASKIIIKRVKVEGREYLTDHQMANEQIL